LVAARTLLQKGYSKVGRISEATGEGPRPVPGTSVRKCVSSRGLSGLLRLAKRMNGVPRADIGHGGCFC
jgi:hypothetical protein